MKDTALRQLRDNDLFRAYKEAIREHDFDRIIDAVDWIIHRPAPRFYMSSKSASDLISLIERGDSLSCLHAGSRRRIREVYARYRRAKEEGVTGSRELVLEDILCEPAPEWYIGRISAKEIIRRQRKLAQEELSRRYGRCSGT